MIEWITDSIFLYSPVLAFLMGMAVTWALLPAIIRVSYKKHLVDEPTGVRKVHSSTTPNLGGVAFYFTLLVIFLISGYALQVWTPYLFAGLTILFFSGVKDDILVLSARRKLVLQLLASALLVVGGELVITDMGGVFGFTAIPYWVGFLLTMFTVIVVINAYNLIDGIDGLAGMIGLLATLCFGSWFWSIGNMPYAILAFVCAGSLIGFLRFNFQPASIFMGDTGSQVIGFMLAFFAVSFVKTGVTSAAPVPFQSEVPVLVLAVLIVPLYDTLRVFGLRAWCGGSPFKADRLHIHHQLLDVGFSDKAACFIILSLNIAIIGLAMMLSGYNVNLLLGVILLSSAVLFPTMGIKRAILLRLGVNLPTARHIRYFEYKHGINKGRDEEKNTDTREGEKEKKDLERIAV